MTHFRKEFSCVQTCQPSGPGHAWPRYAARVRSCRREAAFAWLDEHGHGDLIKTEIVVDLPKENRADALDLITKLRSEGYEPSVSEAVHHGTLSKWLKEMIKRGEVVPLDVLGGEIGTEAKIKKLDDEE